MLKERNHLLDSIKLFCALLVVFIHCEYPYKAQVLPITDVAVPLFFAMSGYLVLGTRRWKERIVRICKIFAFAAALYLLKTELIHLFTGSHLWIPTRKNIIDFVLFNDVAFSLHLWYLPAYIYVLLIAYIIDKYNLWKWALLLIIPLLMLGVYIKYSCPIQEVHYYRNAIFNGLPYFLVGVLAKNIPAPAVSKWKPVLIITIVVFL